MNKQKLIENGQKNRRKKQNVWQRKAVNDERITRFY